MKRIWLRLLAVAASILLLAGCQREGWKRQRIEKWEDGQVVWEESTQQGVEAFFDGYFPEEDWEETALPEGAALLGEFVFYQEETAKLLERRPENPAYLETSRSALYRGEDGYYLVERVNGLEIAASTRQIPAEVGERLAALGEEPSIANGADSSF